MKIICVGRNYIDHAKELNNPVPDTPFFFIKPSTALIKNNDPFVYPSFSKEVHYEVEIVVKIDRLGKNIKLELANDYYSEIGIGIDFTARDLQSEYKSKGYPWEQAKAFDGSAPIGKFINKNNLLSVDAINFSLDVNGKTVQNSNTKNLIFPINELIAQASIFFTLEAGDLVFTGTPVGVGCVQKGDRLVAYIEKEKILDFFVK